MKSGQDDCLSVEKLVASNECVPPYAVVSQVTDRFFHSAQLEAVALVEGREPVGLVTRPKLLFTLFRRYGFELYGRKPIIAIADTAPLILHKDERLDVAIDRALDRPAQDIYDDIIVVDNDGAYRGLLSVKQMVIQQSNALANSIVQKEMARERAKEFEKTNQIKSRFIANVTHELRSPVNAIIGLAELMRMSSEKGYVDQLKDRLSLLMSSATNLRAIITNILDLSKIEAGKMEVMCEHFDAVATLREAAEVTRILIGNKPVDVEVVTHDSPVFIVSDPIKVRQILTNLTSNAAKFTDRGKIVLTLNTEEDRLKISVKDTGIGIKEDDLDKLFTAFGQLGDAKTKRHEGTGLGLTITKNLLDLLGGSISISSRCGEGTTFEVYVPLNRLKKW
ncbi:MAG: ATP-binding protein [Nitrospirae bacterium]|nr:ATP-binding protein [Nitrospirota bacterium]MCL5237134.1 ATP-binding protein [Nitrospirota bacterium]